MEKIGGTHWAERRHGEDWHARSKRRQGETVAELTMAMDSSHFRARFMPKESITASTAEEICDPHVNFDRREEPERESVIAPQACTPSDYPCILHKPWISIRSLTVRTIEQPRAAGQLSLYARYQEKFVRTRTPKTQ